MLHRLAVLTDMDLAFKRPDPTLFPGIPKNVEVHGGFAKEHKKTASIILTEVKRLMAEYSSTSVILVHLHRLDHSASEQRANFIMSSISIYRLATHSAGRLRNSTRSS